MISVYNFSSTGYDNPRCKGKIFTENDVNLFSDMTRNARMVKILSHLFIKDEWSLWTDGDIELLKSPEEILEKYKDRGDIVFMKHRQRACVYDEADAVWAGKRDTNKAIVEEQMNTYTADGYPRRNGLFETGVVLRHHTPEVMRFNEFWWAQNCRFSKRDQLSVNYSVWKCGIKVGLFDGHFNASEDFYIHGHLPNSSFLQHRGNAS